MKTRSVTRRVVPVLVAGASFFWGLAAGEYRVFPYDQVRAVKNLLDGEDGARDPRLYVGSPHSVTIGLGDRVWGTKADVVMVGDSITAGGRWNEIFPEISIANRGVGGDTVRGVRERIPAIQDVGARKIFLMIGTNDVVFDNPVDVIVSEYSKVVRTLKTADTQVYIQSILQCGQMDLCTDARRERIGVLNKQLAELAEATGADFIDLNSYLANENGLRSEFTWDGLHLNSAGYTQWRDVLTPYLDGP